MLLATLADDNPRGGGVTYQQGTFDPYKYGEMTVNGKLVRSGPSSSGDSFWDQGSTPSDERSIITTDTSRQTSAPVYKTPQDAVVNQYITPTINTINYTPPSLLESIAESVKSVITPLDLPLAKPVVKSNVRTEYVTAAPDYFSLDSIFKSFGLNTAPQTVVSVTQPKQKTQPRVSTPSVPRSPFNPPAVRQSNIQSLQMPQFQTAAPRLRSLNTMIPVIAMSAAGVALLIFGIALLRKKA